MIRLIVLLLALFANYLVALAKPIEDGKDIESKALEFSKMVLSADSVCVNPSKPIELSNRLIKRTDKAVKILNSSILYQSKSLLDGEFTFKNPDILSSNINEENDFITLEFEYQPLNPGWDTVRFGINYEIDGEQHSSSFDFIGYGVKQNITLFDAIGARISNDTIYIDETRVGDSHAYKIVLQNNSNFPYGINEQSILKEQINQNEDAFVFDKFFLPGSKHLAIGECDTAIIRFSPNDLKTYIGRIILNSDMNAREIKNLNASARQSIFYISARGVAPLISISTDSIKFPNIEASASCPVAIDTTFTIYNKGTQTLRISSIKIAEDFAEIPFQFDNDEIVIAPNSKHTFAIKLITDNLDFDKQYNFTLSLKNNSINIPDLTLPLSFSLQKRPNLSLSVPELCKARSGQIIEIPIITEKDKIKKASEFTATLSYNKDILEYITYSQSGTASVTANSANVLDTGIASVFISCKVDNNSFIAADTLIKLRFRTYLSDSNISPLLLSNCTVGNSDCPKLYGIDTKNGEFILDSIPGLDVKLQLKEVKPIVVKSLFPNPAFDRIYLNLSASDIRTIHIDLLNSTSALVHKLSDISLSKGGNSIAIDVNQIPPGLYYLRINYDNYTELIKFNIVK